MTLTGTAFIALISNRRPAKQAYNSWQPQRYRLSATTVISSAKADHQACNAIAFRAWAYRYNRHNIERTRQGGRSTRAAGTYATIRRP